MKLSYLQKYEKENNQSGQLYSTKTKKYSNIGPPQNKFKNINIDNAGSLYKRKVSPFGQNNALNPRQYSPKLIDFPANQQYSQKQRYSPLNTYEKNTGRENDNENYKKYLQKSFFDKRQRLAKTPNYADFETSGDPSEKSDLSITGYRRENVRAKGIQIKMNNIDNINDKIGALLNMVKRNGSKTPKKIDKQREQYNFIDVSPKRKYPQNGDITFDNSKSKWDKPKRMKTYSGYDIDQDSLNYAYPVSKMKSPNEEDRVLQYERSPKMKEKEYSPRPDKERNNYGYIYNHQEQNRSPNNRHARCKTNVVPKEQKYYAQQFCAKPSNRQPLNSVDTIFDYRDSQRDYSLRPGQYQVKNEESCEKEMVPLSLQGLKNYSEQKSIGSCLIDQKLKKIQEKIAESESGKNRIQRRLDEKATQFSNYQGQETKAGKLYKRCDPIYEQSFELKVYPVKVDRENIVAVASSLLEQVQFDVSIREAREEFLKDESETKWEDLQRGLQERGVKMTFTQLKEIVSISAEQFSLLQETPRNSSSTLADLLAEAQKHWEKKVCGCAYLRALKKENFKESEIDTERKGYISQENLVSFINRFTGRTLLLRDVSLIFRRLQLLEGMRQNNGVEYSTFLRVIAL